MIRALGIFGLPVLFLMVSPVLRVNLMSDLGSFEHTVEVYSPLSYVGIALVVVAGLMFCLHRASQPRT
jgi:succinate dehydrogenase/fumarate reductase cytochrome b subunit